MFAQHDQMGLLDREKIDRELAEAWGRGFVDDVVNRVAAGNRPLRIVVKHARTHPQRQRFPEHRGRAAAERNHVAGAIRKVELAGVDAFVAKQPGIRAVVRKIDTDVAAPDFRHDERNGAVQRGCRYDELAATRQMAAHVQVGDRPSIRTFHQTGNHAAGQARIDLDDGDRVAVDLQFRVRGTERVTDRIERPPHGIDDAGLGHRIEVGRQDVRQLQEMGRFGQELACDCEHMVSVGVAERFDGELRARNEALANERAARCVRKVLLAFDKAHADASGALPGLHDDRIGQLARGIRRFDRRRVRVRDAMVAQRILKPQLVPA